MTNLNLLETALWRGFSREDDKKNPDDDTVWP